MALETYYLRAGLLNSFPGIPSSESAYTRGSTRGVPIGGATRRTPKDKRGSGLKKAVR